MKLLCYDPSAAFIERTGLSREDLQELAPELENARDEVLADERLWAAGGKVPSEKLPLDAGFLELPRRLLAEYERDRQKSELGRILSAGRRLAGEVDRVVVLGIGGSYMGARALFESCCHPYHNDLSRADRGRWPRIYFQGNNADNDSSQGLLDLLGRDRPSQGTEDGWGIVVISKSGGTLETAVAFRQFLAALEDGGANAAQRVLAVTGNSGRLFDLAKAIGCQETFGIPDGVGGRFSIFTAVGLLPAVLMGLDVTAFLAGAAAMNDVFRNAPPGANPVLDYVGVSHILERDCDLDVRVLSTWGQGLEAAGFWYDQLLSESLGKEERGATPVTVVNTRDLHSRGQQHQEGKRDKLITNLAVDQPRRDPLPVGRSQRDQDGLNALADKTVSDILNAALAGTNQAYAQDGRPTTMLRLPKLDEASLGQFFQMMMLATVLEGRLIGINPYGQPGVEAYKKNMNAILRR